MEQIINEEWTYDEYGFPMEHTFELKEGVEINLQGEIEVIPCLTDDEDLGLVPIDPGFPQQAAMRSSHMITCRTEIATNTETSFEIVVTVPGDYDVMFRADSSMMEPPAFGDETLDTFFEDDMLMMDENMLSPVMEDGNTVIRTGLRIEIDPVYQDKQTELERLRNTPARNRRDTTPRITNVLPRTGSPRGGQIITIVGTNLDSNNLNIGGTQDNSVPGHGEDYFFYFERAGFSIVPCTVNRMFNLLARQVGPHRTIFCETQKVPRQGTWRF